MPICPLLNNREIDEEECNVIAFAAEEIIPESQANQEAVKVRDYKEICSKCKFHISE